MEANVVNAVRTLRYKTITVAGLGLGIPGYLLMALRWRFRINAWESLYYVAGGFSNGMSLNAQFVGLTAAAPEEQKGAAIGVYYLSQQVGMILGVGGFAALRETVFSNNLRRALSDCSGRDEVGPFVELKVMERGALIWHVLDHQRRTQRRAIGVPTAGQDTGCRPFGIPVQLLCRPE